jgi:peptidoglycan/xylan/chitin deacetylase (PgdA/CDA1 family)
VALTIDDGPSSSSTGEIAAILDDCHAAATFFVLGDRVEGRRGILETLVRGGHELGNHFYRDQATVRLSASEIESQLLRTDALLRPLSHPHWVRPGSGWFSRRMLDVVSRHGYRLVLGSVYPLDAHLPMVTLVSREVLRHVHPGAIIILHDGEARGRRTAKVLTNVVPELRRRGYELVTVSKLLADATRSSSERHTASGDRRTLPAEPPDP